MSLPDAGAISMSAIATQLGVSTSGISLSNLGNTASSGYTSNVKMSFFYTPTIPSVSYDSINGIVTVTVQDFWPAGSTYSFYRTAAGGSSTGAYAAQSIDQVSVSYEDSAVIAGKSYWWKVSVNSSNFSREGLRSDPVQIICV